MFTTDSKLFEEHIHTANQNLHYKLHWSFPKTPTPKLKLSGKLTRCCRNWRMTVWMVRYSEKLASITVMIFFIFCNSSMSWITYQIQLCCVNSPWRKSSFFQFYWSFSLSKSLSMAFHKVQFLEWYCSWIYKMVFNPVHLTSQLLNSMTMTQV